ncbi:MAG: cardiolipin synthase [Desulfotomaculaceae bacterium]|nr:cardiolipin synthase [Desulfotomaculaceae bacterium]
MSKPKPAATRHKRTRGTLRVAIVFLALCGQLLLLAFFVSLLRQNAVYLYFSLEIVGAAVMAFIVTKNRNSSYTIFWLMIMMILPVFGYLLFLLWGTTGLTHRKSKTILENIDRGRAFLEQDPVVYADFLNSHAARQRLGTYLLDRGFPVCNNTQCTYYPLGELQFDKMIEDMEMAEKFIFLEYFIIAEGRLWDRIHALLRQKVQQGVEVRILFDDLGSIIKVSDSLVTELVSEGIQAIRFNPVHAHIFRLLINYRNHQKIAIIDGHIGYTGGTNIADEYVNYTNEMGHWKDTAIRLTGAAVWSLTVTFLQMWDSESNRQSVYQHYMPVIDARGAGFFQPFADGPVNNPDNPAAEVYSQIIAGAQQYVYITTPYLVIDNAMKDTLCMAARGGIDVRIVTPKTWDHWYVHMVTQSNYGELLAAGVRIYEYTPGFLHAKIILSDDDNGVIGSINMDYRSFFLHFENGVWICGAPVLQEIKTDLLALFAVSEEIGLEKWIRRPQYKKIAQDILRLFAPLF